jgi:OPA family glycerol-3-phosphate transporter-like MFS transporter
VISPSSPGAVPEAFADAAYRRRRTQNWLILGFLYASFYMSRYNFAAVMDNLGATFGWSNTRLGIFEFVMPLVYGLSVVLNGPWSDRIGGRRAFLFGAVGVTFMNVLFGLGTLVVQRPAVVERAATSPHALQVLEPAVLRFGLSGQTMLVILATLWAFNGYFQSFGALSIVKVNAQWFHVRERGTFSGIFGVLIRFGLILAFSGVPLIAAHIGLAWAFLLPGFLVAALFVANFLWVADSPKEAGFGDPDTGDGSAQEGGAAPGLRFVFKKVFASRAAWLIALSSMMLGMVRRSTVDSWFGKYFSNVYLAPGADKSSYAPYQLAAWGIALLGIAGGFTFGMASDRIFQTRRAPLVTIGFLGMASVLLFFGLSDRVFHGGPWAAAILLAMLSFFVNGAHGMIGGAASMDFGGKRAAATAAGLFDGMQYLASAFVGLGMGWVLDHWGWSAWQFVPVPFALIGVLLISQLWSVVPGNRAAAPPIPVTAAPRAAADA